MWWNHHEISSLRIHQMHRVGLVLRGVMTHPPLTADAGGHSESAQIDSNGERGLGMLPAP